MQDTDRIVTVFAPNTMGADFVRQLRGAGLPVAAISNNVRCSARMEKLGVKHIWHVNTSRTKAAEIPLLPVGRIYVFEQSFALTCRLLQQCRAWTYDPITVITKQHFPRSIYRLLGADMVVYTQSDQVSFLLTELIYSEQRSTV
ncbi:hypothetical protein MH117_21935 [Paenibacillus sp. ACRRX]|uniref:hypothetical protein n=1 Tax=Paenibacillus sp. ACRRX TaxID=2918206 RepID=UPI001EF5BEB0|nr:hypothetical protein [Paenibacillus sp. ACRRX]MCG7410077.1 hypothetical protein [Paenibacillus sp. ACRRX]